MYSVRYGDACLHDPYADTVVCLSARVWSAPGEHGTCELVIPREHPEAAGLAVRDQANPLTVWDGDRCLFEGFVWEIRETMAGDIELACKGGMAWLADTTVPPYSTKAGEAPLSAPSDPAGLLRWYVERHNERVGVSQRLEIGVNDGNLLDANAYVYRSSTQRPTTYDEIIDKLIRPLGGVLMCRWDGRTRWLDWHAECAGASEQVIDFGVNLVDYLRSDSADGMVTALVAVGGIPDGTDVPLTLDGIEAGEVAPGVMLKDGVIWSVDAVAERGWAEAVYESEALTQEGLLESALSALKQGLGTSLTIEADAIDLSTLGAADPLAPGEYVRVRSRPHGIDEYLLVSSVDLDLSDPSKSRYTLGVPTGSYLATLSRLNASVRSQADAVEAISEAAKAAAEDADAAREAAEAAAGAAGGEVPIVALSSTNGTVFKRNLGVSTTIIATIYVGGSIISTAQELTEHFGAAAYLEWGWKDIATDAAHALIASDARISLQGFALTVSPDDVDTQAIITCSLNY